MKKVKLLLVVSVAVLIGLSSCEKSANISLKSVAGTYKGTLSVEKTLKSLSTTNADSTYTDSMDATMEVSDLGNGQLELHCFGGDLDTTFMLNEYLNNDSMMVCLTGDAFEEMYGHMMGNGNGTMSDSTYNNMGNGMMGNGNAMQGGNITNWMSHMNNEHKDGDQHFGGFDLNLGTFGYIMQGKAKDYKFQGKRE